MAGRFASLSEEELQVIVSNKDSNNTKKSTSVSVNILRDYLLEKNEDIHFETLCNKDLDNLLCKFYAEARTSKGDLYKKSTLQAIRHGINRHLKLNGVHKGTPVDIVHGIDFSKSRSLFDAMKKELKRSGKRGVVHKDIISDEDFSKLYTYFRQAESDPAVLLQKTFFEVVFYFGRRGRENLHKLKKQDFVISGEASGQPFVKKITDEQTKNHQDDDGKSGDGIMYAVKGK